MLREEIVNVFTTHQKKVTTWESSISWIEGIISQWIDTSKHHVVRLKYIYIMIVNHYLYSSLIKVGKKAKAWALAIERHEGRTLPLFPGHHRTLTSFLSSFPGLPYGGSHPRLLGDSAG